MLERILGLKMNRLHSVLAVMFLIVSLFLSCDVSEKSADEGGRVQSKYDEPPVVDDRELNVLQATPQGDVAIADLRKEIYIVFNHPLVPLAVLDKETKGVFSVEPAVSGKFRWYGSRICAFVPDSGWVPDTGYKVTVPAGLKSINDKKLAKDYVFSFRVGASNLTADCYPSDYYTVDYDQNFELGFNFPVTIDELSKHITVTSSRKVIPCRFALSKKRYYYDEGDTYTREEEITGTSSSRIVITPLEKFARNSEVIITLKSGMRSDEGTAKLAGDQTFTYRTHGPLEVSLNDDAMYFQYTWGMELNFTNEVDMQAAMKAIKFSPEAKPLNKSSYKTKTISLREWNIRPGVEYKITVVPFEDVHGNRLSKGQVFTVSVPDYYPDFLVDNGMNLLEAEAGHRLPVEATGIGEFYIDAGYITMGDLQKKLAGGYNYNILNNITLKSSVWKTGLGRNDSARLGYDISQWLTDGKYGWIALRYRTNAYSTGNEGMSDQSVVQVVQSTNLGVVVKEDYWNVYAWVNPLSGGPSRKGVKIGVYDTAREIASGFTDESGFCRIKKALPGMYDKAIFYAEQGRDRTYFNTQDNDVYMYSLASYDQSAPARRVSGQFVFDRKLYRPGDEVFWKAILAVKENGKLVPLSRESVVVSIEDSEGKTLYEEKLRTTENGGVWGSLKTDQDGSLGHYRIEVKSAGSKYSYADDTFQVEEFRPVSFTVDINGIRGARSGETVKLTVEGNYMFGAPMGKAPVSYSVSRSKRSVEFDRFAGYVFGDNLYWFNEETSSGTGYYTGGESALNAAGKYVLNLNLKPLVTEEKVSDPDARYTLNDPYNITIEATVRDVDQKSVTKTETFAVYPGSFLIGIRPYDTYRGYREVFKFDVVAVSNTGEAVSGKKADVRIIKNTWKSVRTKGPDGSFQTKNTLEKKVVYSAKVTLSGSPETIEFRPGSAGIYTITVQESGGGAYARSGFYAYGEDFSSWNFGDDDSVTLIPDKASYNPGDEAKVLIQSPYKKCKAIITLERETVYWQKTIDIEGNGTPVTVPIKKEYLPNVYMSVMLVRPRVKPDDNLPADVKKNFEDNDLGCPRFRAGIVKLNVSTASNIAKMEVVTDRESYGPGDTMKIKIYSEPNAEIALSVADRGVLDLINYSYSDPVSLFFSNWPLGVRIFQNMNLIIKQYKYSMKGASPGGGDDDGYGGEGLGGFSVMGEDGTRRDIRYTAFWKPDIKTDSKGYAEVQFRLPDNLSTFRIMAVVAAGNKFREYKKEFKVRKAMVVQKSVPRFIRTGDRLQVGAVVINQTGIASDFKVTLEADMLSIDDAVKTVYLKPGEAKEVLFDITLDNKKYAEINRKITEAIRSGRNDIEKSINVRGYITAEPANFAAFTKAGFSEKDIRDRLFYEFPVLNQPLEEAFSISGFTDGSYSDQIVFPSEKDVLPYYGGLRVQFSSTALVGLNRAFSFYECNPYMCAEQRSSAFLLMVSSGTLLKKFSYKPPAGVGYDFANIEKLFLGEIRDFQNSDGGFSLWKVTGGNSEKHSSPYLSAYVTFALSVAKSKGYSVDQDVLDKAVSFLKKYLKEPSKDGYSYVLETISLINYAFCLADMPDSSISKMLLENRKSLSFRAKGYLALSMAHQKKLKNYNDDSSVKEIMNEFKNSMEITDKNVTFRNEITGSYRNAYYSDGSVLAVILMCFIELDRSNPLIPDMVRFILSSRANRYWDDTHSIAFIALAIEKYHTDYEMNGAGMNSWLFINSKEVLKHTFEQGSADVFIQDFTFDSLYSIGDAGIKYPLEFRTEKGTRRLYYSATLVYQPVIPDVTPRDEGMEIRRVVYDLSTATEKNPYGEEVKGDLKRGEIYLCRIFVVNPKPYFNAVIVDPLPSNVEILNTSFATEKQSLAEKTTAGSSGSGYDDYWWYYSAPVIEYRDDRVVIFEDYLSAGLHEYTYLIRPTVKGDSYAPPASSKLMYEPEVFGRTGAVKVNVK